VGLVAPEVEVVAHAPQRGDLVAAARVLVAAAGELGEQLGLGGARVLVEEALDVIEIASSELKP
jgi:hypothetical protein